MTTWDQIDKPWNEMTSEERKHMVALAKIGMLALVDEATTYQEHRKPDSLRTIFESLERSNEMV